MAGGEEQPSPIRALVYRLFRVPEGDLPGGGFVYHVEFRSIEDPARPIPVSETGYLSHFLMAGQALDPEALRAYALDLGRGLVEARSPGGSSQPSLFG